MSSEVAERKVCGGCGAAVTMRYFCDESTGVAVETFDRNSLAGYGAEVVGQGERDGVLGEEGQEAAGKSKGKGKREMMKVKEHIFVGQKPDWYRIPEDDGARQWDRFPPDFEDIIVRWKREMGVKY